MLGLSLLPLLVFSVALIIIPGNSAFVSDSDRGVERDRRHDYHGSEPPYFIRSGLRPLQRHWTNRPATFAGKTLFSSALFVPISEQQLLDVSQKDEAAKATSSTPQRKKEPGC
jgi:hypothetical protein